MIYQRTKDIARRIDYFVKTVDMEEGCLYKDLGNGAAIEVSGINNRKADPVVCVYAWRKDTAVGEECRLSDLGAVLDRTEKLLRGDCNGWKR